MQCDKRVLVVDDDLSVHHLYKQLLGVREQQEEDGGIADLMSLVDMEEEPSAAESECMVTLVDQGQGAVDAVRESLQRQSPYQLVFLDMRLPPGMDGKRTALEIRKLQPRLPIVFISAYSDYSEEELRRLLPSAPIYFSYKPFTRADLEQAIESWAL